MPKKNTFLLSSAITPELLEAYPEIGLLQHSPSHGQNLEKLGGSKQYAPYNIRLNKKVRTICTPVKIEPSREKSKKNNSLKAVPANAADAKSWIKKLNFYPEREKEICLYDTTSINLLCTTQEGREIFLRLCQFPKFSALLKPMTFIEPLKSKSFPHLNNLSLYNYLRKNHCNDILDTLQRQNPILCDTFSQNQEQENPVGSLSVTLRK